MAAPTPRPTPNLPRRTPQPPTTSPRPTNQPAARQPASDNRQKADTNQATDNQGPSEPWYLSWLFLLGCSGPTATLLLIGAIIFFLVTASFTSIVGGEKVPFLKWMIQNAIGSYNGIAVNSANGSSVDCSGAAKVPQQYLPWVQDAANKYLNGDQAKLIALIQVESSWNTNATTYNSSTHVSASSAAGLGQFLYGTAEDYVEFKGGTDRFGRHWSGGVIYHDKEAHNHMDDIRFQPEPAIYAAAEKWSNDLASHGNDLYSAYLYGYNGSGNSGKDPGAIKTAYELVQVYNRLVNGGGCQTTTTVGPEIVGQYYPPLGTTPIIRFNTTPHTTGDKGHGPFMASPLGVGFDNTYDSAIDLFTGDGKAAPVYSVFSGTVTATDPDFRSSYGKGGAVVWVRATDGTTGAVYAHIKLAPGIKSGATVQRGQQIGNVAINCRNTSDSQCVDFTSGEHLHFQFYLNRSGLNKQQLIAQFGFKTTAQ